MTLQVPAQDIPHILYAIYGAIAYGIIHITVFLLTRWYNKKETKAEENEKKLADAEAEKLAQNSKRIEQLEKDLLEFRMQVLENLLQKFADQTKKSRW